MCALWKDKYRRGQLHMRVLTKQLTRM